MLDTVLGREDMHRGTSLLYSRALQESKRQTARSRMHYHFLQEDTH